MRDLVPECAVATRARSRCSASSRSNETHASTTDPEAKLARKGNNQAAKLSYLANALMENRNGLLVDLRVEPATGYGERVGALAMLDEHVPDSEGITLGADAGYDTADFVHACRERGITPHVAQTRDKRRRSVVDGRRFATPDTRSANDSGSASRRSSDGRRPSPASGRLDSEATLARSSPPTSPPPPTTCSGSPSWYPRSLPLSPTLSPGCRRGRGGIGAEVAACCQGGFFNVLLGLPPTSSPC